MTKQSSANALKSIPMEELSSWIGKEIGPTEWLQITQEQINQFASCTNDEQWIHTDASRAAKESPFGTTISHGFLTLSLLSFFVHQGIQISDANVAINYGLNRVRFPHPVKVDNHIRARITVASCEAIESGIQYTLKVSIEIQGASKPACVAEPIFRALK